jgi:hypothetical protein
MEKAGAANQAIFEKVLASGRLVAYGSDMNMPPAPDGATHDTWWSAVSMAGLLQVLAEIHKSGNATSSGNATINYEELPILETKYSAMG